VVLAARIIQETLVWAPPEEEPPLGAIEPGDRLKPSSSCERKLESELVPVEAVVAWPGWLARASSAIARKPAAATAIAVCFAPAARRRAASILEGFCTIPGNQSALRAA
jgi:hypothetical protein